MRKGKALRRIGPMEGRLAQIMPTPGSMTDQMLALTEVPRVEHSVSHGLHPKRNKA